MLQSTLSQEATFMVVTHSLHLQSLQSVVHTQSVRDQHVSSEQAQSEEIITLKEPWASGQARGDVVRVLPHPHANTTCTKALSALTPCFLATEPMRPFSWRHIHMHCKCAL